MNRERGAIFMNRLPLAAVVFVSAGIPVLAQSVDPKQFMDELLRQKQIEMRLHTASLVMALRCNEACSGQQVVIFQIRFRSWLRKGAGPSDGLAMSGQMSKSCPGSCSKTP